MGTSVLPGDLGTGCPPGFIIDYLTGECSPDPLAGPTADFPILIPITGGTGSTNLTQSSGDTQAQGSTVPGAAAVAVATASAINNSVTNYTIQNSIDTGPIGSAISSGIGNVVDSINQNNQQVANTISGSVNQFTNSLFGWAKNVGEWLVQHIGAVLQTIASHIKDIASTVIDTVGKAVSAAVNTLGTVIAPAIQSIATGIQKVVDFYRDHIQPILATVTSVVQSIAATEKAIEADLHSGIQGLLNLPTDIANGLQQIDQALIRAGLALRVKRKSDADVYFYGDEPGSFAAHIKSLGESVIGLAPTKEKTTYSPGKETLDEPTLAQELPPLLNSVYTILGDICKGLKNLPSDYTSVLEVLGIAGTGLALSFTSPFLLLGSALAMVRGPFNVVSELAEQRAFQAAPIRKLDPAALTEAVRRNFIDAKTMDAELALQGYDSERGLLLRKLSVFLEPASTLVDYLFRQIITDDDFKNGLHDLGYTDPQIDALKEASTRIIDVQDILTAWRRNDVDEKTVDDTLGANRFTDAQGQLLKALAFAPTGYADANRHFLTGRFLSDYGFDPNSLPQPPKEVRDAGRADGLSDDAIAARWNGAINTLDPSQWLALYWRQQASQKQLQVSLDTIRVPDFLQQLWIDSQRPIIPFRTIPAMIKAGILTESEGLLKLQAHGYSLDDAVLLIKYAGAASAKSKGTTASGQHAVSVAAAKTLYSDGAISRDQFSTILAEHGFDASSVGLEVQLADLQDAIVARRTLGTDVVNEYQAGFITHDQAVQRLAASNLTQAEQAKYVRQLKATKAAKAKLPSEAELRQMAIHGVISEDDYSSGLVANGFSQEWADRFRTLHFPPGGSTTTP